MQTQYRYSQASFKRSVLTALGLTLIVSFLVWLFTRLLVLTYGDLITLVSALLFFSFCSAAMIWRYCRKEVVVAIRPDGLFDRGYSSQAVPWDEIKDLRLERTENSFALEVYLWPKQRSVKPLSALTPHFIIELEPLDAALETILEALGRYKTVVMERY